VRNWITIVGVFVLLVGGGVLLTQLRAGEPLRLTSGYIPQLDAAQALLLAGAVGALVVLTGGLGVGLAFVMLVGGRQVARVQAEAAREAASRGLREPSKAAPKAGPARMPNWGNFGKAAAVAANLLVIAFVLFLTLNHYVLNPPAEGEPAVEAGGLQSAPATAAPAAQPASPAELQAAFQALPAGDATRGQTEFTAQPCASCHSLVPDQVLVGPSLAGIGTQAAGRRPGYSAELYLYESIIQPGAHVVEGFQNGLMPPNFAQILAPQQQADLVAYLASLK